MKTPCISLAVFCLLASLNPAIARQVEWVAGTDLLYTNPATARVAVGNDEASAALDVKGGIVVRNNVTPRGTVKGNERLRMTGNTSDYIVAVQDGTGRVQHYWNASTGASSTYLVDGEPAGKLLFSPTGELFSVRYAPAGTAGAPITWKPYFHVKNTGNVGIGLSAPDEKLTVNGRVKAQEVIVTQDAWPDFVFDDGYPLISLDELAHYLAKHGHLPDIPSRAEVQQQGVAVGKLQAKLLQKIEELTLYVIAQHKRIHKLENALGDAGTF